jgi:hypothetical protein
VGAVNGAGGSILDALARAAGNPVVLSMAAVVVAAAALVVVVIALVRRGRGHEAREVVRLL